MKILPLCVFIKENFKPYEIKPMSKHAFQSSFQNYNIKINIVG